jgi:hypothetical protein
MSEPHILNHDFFHPRYAMPWPFPKSRHRQTRCSTRTRSVWEKSYQQKFERLAVVSCSCVLQSYSYLDIIHQINRQVAHPQMDHYSHSQIDSMQLSTVAHANSSACAKWIMIFPILCCIWNWQWSSLTSIHVFSSDRVMLLSLPSNILPCTHLDIIHHSNPLVAHPQMDHYSYISFWPIRTMLLSLPFNISPCTYRDIINHSNPQVAHPRMDRILLVLGSR